MWEMQENGGNMTDKIKKILNRKKTMITAIALIVLLLFAFKAMAADRPTQETGNNALTVEIQEVKLTDSMSGLTYKADLEPAEQAVVSSTASGNVTQVLFEDGDKVSKGQVLACLDDKDLQNQLQTAKIDLNKLQLELASKQNDFNTAKVLYENGACSKTSYDAAELAYRTALANVELRKIGIQDINNSINDMVIRAAIGGEIGGKSISIGQYVNPGSTLGNIKNNSSIKAVIHLLQDDLERVSAGQTVTLKLKEKDDKTYQGVVETIAASADSQSRVFDCLIKFNNTDGALNSGITGYIDISGQNKNKIVAVPMSAVTGSEGDYSVYTIKDKKAQKVTVTIGAMSEDLVEITSGIQEGDKIIVSNLSSLQDGDKVQVSGEGK